MHTSVCSDEDAEECTWICGKMDILEGQFIKLAEIFLQVRVTDLRNPGQFDQRD